MNVQQKPFGITYCNMHPGQEDFKGFFTGNDCLMAFDEFIKLDIWCGSSAVSSTDDSSCQRIDNCIRPPIWYDLHFEVSDRFIGVSSLGSFLDRNFQPWPESGLSFDCHDFFSTVCSFPILEAPQWRSLRPVLQKRSGGSVHHAFPWHPEVRRPFPGWVDDVCDLTGNGFLLLRRISWCSLAGTWCYPVTERQFAVFHNCFAV